MIERTITYQGRTFAIRATDRADGWNADITEVLDATTAEWPSDEQTYPTASHAIHESVNHIITTVEEDMGEHA